jgi:ABC-2 type transport system permease protein
MRKIWAIASMNLGRLVRDKTAAFFVFVFPFLIILALGAAFGQGATPRLGLVSSGSDPMGNDLVEILDEQEGLETVAFADLAALRRAVERGEVEGGLVIPAGYEDAVRRSDTVPLAYLARPTSAGADLRLTVVAAVDAQSTEVRAARLAVDTGAVGSFDDGLARARLTAATIPPIRVVQREAATGEAVAYGLDAGAAQELVLFVFLTSLSASAMLVESRRLGVSRRMLASPTPMRSILFGEALGRYLIALGQGVLIVIGSLLLFGVDWGNVFTTSVIVAVFAACATGVAMLMGSVLQNAQQTGAFGVFLGLVLAALGGAMVPLEIFPPTMATIAHLTPHAWAIEALNEVQATGTSPAGVATELGILAAYALVLLTVATIMFRRTLTRAPAAA